MARIILRSVILFTITLIAFVLSADMHRRNGVCSWVNYFNTTCPRKNFLCSNRKCIERSLHCNGVNDCGDNSDEKECDTSSSCRARWKKCDRRHYSKCINSQWICDGIRDCAGGEDEQLCENFEYTDVDNKEYIANLKGLHWLYRQSKPESAADRWGPLVDKSAVAFYFADPTFVAFSNGTRKDIAYEVSIQFLSRLFRTKLQDIPSTDLASFVNAFLVSCLDPRKFHGVNIVQELRNRVDQKNYTNPYVFLSLCNAGETITESDKMKLIDTFWNKRMTFWTDMQAVVVMALACASKQPGNEVDLETLRELTMELKQHQYRNGSVENLQTTALVLQALFSTEPDDDPNNFDERRALEQIILSQTPDGSFGNLMNMYFVLPVLNCGNLVNINSDHCQSVRRDEISALENLAKRSGPKIRVRYSLWIENEKVLERHLALRVPSNMSFYGIMEIAAEIDSKYSFEYVVKNRKPYVNAISGLQDNPEKGQFWFLYIVKDGQPSPAQESPADVMPKDNDHYVMWYRSGSWVD